MSLPISGPFHETTRSGGTGVGSSIRSFNRYRQARPYNLALPYEAYYGRTTSYYTSGTWPWHWYPMVDYGNAGANYGISTHVGPVGATGWWPGNHEVDAAVESCRQRFVSKLQENRADWATSLIQRQQSLDMIATRALQLLGAARALRKKGPRAFLKALGSSARSNVRDRPRKSAKAFASAWLEYSYGWTPLVMDIGNSISLLESPFPRSQIRQRVRRSVSSWKTHTYGTYGDRQTRNSQVDIQVVMGAYATIDNPNLFLASQLGFTNPAAVAWELVPFSFVFDWVVNVGDFLESFSAFHGVNLHTPYSTIKATERVTFMESHPDVTHIEPFAQWGSIIVGSTVTNVQRQTSIPSAKLGVRKSGFLNPTRAANAISLLIQGLR